MTSNDAMATFWAVASNTLVQAIALSAAGAVATYLVRTNPKAADVAQDLADLELEIEPWVIRAERMWPDGAARRRQVLADVKAWLAERGINGRRGRLLSKYAGVALEVAVKRVDPKGPAAA
jgi:hypothetical protein